MARRFSVTVPEAVWLALERNVNWMREQGQQLTLPDPLLSGNGDSEEMAVRVPPSKSAMLLQALYLDDAWRARIRKAAGLP